MIQTPQQVLAVRMQSAFATSGKTIARVAEVSGYSDRYIRRVKNGKYRNPTVTFIWAVAAALGVSPAYLVGWDK